MTIEVSYNPTFHDFLALNRWIARRIWRVLRYLSIVVIAFFLASPLLSHDPGREGLLTTYVRSLAVLIIPAVFLVLIPANLYLAARKRWSAAAEIREPRRFLFSEDGITVEGGTFSGRVAWSHITGAETHRGLVILKTNQNMYYLFSEKGFPDETQRDAFLFLVRKKVSPTFGRNSALGRIKFLDPGGNFGRDA